MSQVQDGQEVVIAYFSRTLSKAERNYCVTRKELLAVMKSLEHFHKYLYGQSFHLRTDHSALTWLINFKNLEGQTARWMQRLQEYNFSSEHRRGKNHSNADALSRRPCPEVCKHCTKVEDRDKLVQVCSITLDPSAGWEYNALRTEQMADRDIGPLLKEVESNKRPSWEDISSRDPTYKSYWAQWDSLQVKNGVLIRIWQSPDGKTITDQVILPRSKIKEVLEEMHSGVSGGHLGVNRTIDKVRQRFYWLHLRADVERFYRQCDTCAGSRGPQTRSRGRMSQYNVGAPFERIAMDIAGPFPVTDSQNKYLLVIMDYFTKWPEVFAIPNQEASTVADCLVNNFICRFGVPRELHTDQGRNFESLLMREMLQRLNVHKTRTTPLHPQSDGMVERYINTLLEHLRKVVSSHQRDWDTRVPMFLLAYRSSTHDTTGLSPASILFGRELRLPCDLMFGTPPESPRVMNDHVSQLFDRLQDTHEYARKNLNLASEKMKARYDRKCNSAGFKENELVWLYNPIRKKGKCPKLQRDWQGPYKIVTRINDVVYRIKRHPQGKMMVVHLDRLAPYRRNNMD